MNQFRDKREEHEEDERLALAEDGVARLLDIITQEVSLVNRAANRRKWLVRKGSDAMNLGQEIFETEDGTMTTETAEPESGEESRVEKQMAMPKPVKTAVLGALEQCQTKAAKLVSDIKGMTEDETVEGMPQMLSNEFKGLATALRAIISRYPSPKSKDEPGAENAPEPAAKSDEAGAETASEESEEAETQKQGHSISAAMKTKALAIAEEATNKLASLINKVKAAEESDEAAGMPAEIAQAIEGVAAGLAAGGGGSYPSPKAAKTDATEAKPHTAATPDVPPTPPEGEGENMEKGSPFSVLQEAKSVLGVVMAKLQPGKPIDEDSYQKLDKLRSLLGSAQPNEAKEQNDGDASEKNDVKKAGAKMASARRKRLEEAIKSLLSLFKDVMPAKDLGKFPHLVVSKSESEASEVKTKLQKAEQELAAAREEIATLKERPADSQVATVESAPAASTGEVTWPMDLNAERE